MIPFFFSPTIAFPQLFSSNPPLQNTQTDSKNSKEIVQQAVIDLKTMADSGDPESQFLYALELTQGTGSDPFQDMNKMMSEIENLGLDAESADDSINLLELKELESFSSELETMLPHLFNNSKQAKYNLAIDYLNKATQQNYAPAFNMLGVLFASGKGVEKDESKAFKLYESAFKISKDQGALVNLALAYRNGKGVEKDVSKSFQLLSSVPLKDQSPEVQYQLGLSYLDKQLLTFNPQKAIKLFSSAADVGDAHSALELAKIFEKGDYDIPPSEDKLFEYTSIAAASDIPEALHKLGECYEFGKGCPINVSDAFLNYGEAALRGYIPSLICIAEAFLSGSLVDKDPEQAYFLLQQAHEAGSPEGTFKYAHCVHRGIGCDSDPTKAKELWESISESYPKAKQLLSLHFDQSKVE